VAALLAAAGVSPAAAQIPRLPGIRPGARPTAMARDTTKKDSLAIKWTTPDSVMRALMAKPDYSVTRYQGDTAYFNAQTKAIDLLSANRHEIGVLRSDSQAVVSDSGIYYTEANRHVTTGGKYILTPGNGQADITSNGRSGRVDYNFAQRSALITNARLPVNNGEMWYMDVALARVVVDSVNTKKITAYVGGRGGTMTSCDDSIPDWHFAFKEAKKTGNVIIASPAVLYIKDIPVAWLPFVFTDQAPGRHSGILAPQFGVGDIVRNSPSYRRNVDHVGYYWAISDYMDASAWLDWRSSAGAVSNDPGWLRYNGDGYGDCQVGAGTSCTVEDATGR